MRGERGECEKKISCFFFLSFDKNLFITKGHSLINFESKYFG